MALGAIDPAVVTGARGRLSLGDASRAFVLDPARPSVEIPVRGASPLQLDAELLCADGAVIPLARSVPASERLVLLNQPASVFSIVDVVLHDPLGRYHAAFVELEDLAGARRAVKLDAASPRARWSARRTEGGAHRHRVRLIGADAAITETGWIEASGALLVVGDLDTRVEPLVIVLAGASGAAGSLGALLRVTSLAPPEGVAPTVESLLDPGVIEARLRLPFKRDAERRYRVEGSVFFEDREITIGPIEDSKEVLIVIAAGA